MIKKAICVISVLCVMTSSAFAEADWKNGLEHRTISLGQTTRNRGQCEVGILYEPKQNTAEVIISAITYGQGSDSRKWTIEDLKLDVEGNRLKPESAQKFYVEKESLFRYPAAVVFGAIGTQYSVSGVTAGSAGDIIGKAGMAAALLLIVSQAKGEVTGTTYAFKLDSDTAASFESKGGTIRIVTENAQKHQKERLVVKIEPDDAIFKGEVLTEEGFKVPQ